MTPNDAGILEHGDAIRKAFKAGQKTIVINKKEFTIKKVTRQVSFTAGGQQQKRRESWLLVNPADGSMFPSGQVEVQSMENLRTKLG